MERIIKYGGKLFFGSLVICILSFFYFKLIPCTKISNLIGYIFLEAFLGYNFYIGYKSYYKNCQKKIMKDTKIVIKEEVYGQNACINR